jgi:hypothetical protein
MRSAVAAILVVTAGLVLANMLGVAAAEAPTTSTMTPVRTITVDGVATVAVAQGASAAVATAAYREGMAAAVADGQNKAEFLASKTAATLGNVQSVIEGGGSIQCKGEESAYLEYEGEQPDFGSPSVAVRGPVAAPESAAVAPNVRKPAVKHPRKKRKKKPAAKAAAVTACTLQTDVTLVYAIS